MKFELDKFGRHVTDEELLADLQQVASTLKTNSLTQREYKKHGKFGVTIFITRFGSWSTAGAKAGLTSSRNRTSISEAELLADLKCVSNKLNNDSLTKDEYNQHGKYNSSTYETRFGSWMKAKEEAGLKRREHPSISDEEYFTNLEEVWIKLGKQPRFADMHKPISKYSGSGYVHNFGTWRKALEEFIEYVNTDAESANINGNPIDVEDDIRAIEPGTEFGPKETTPDFKKKVPISKKSKRSVRSEKSKPNKREVGDRLRFRVMRRDNFKCQFCGRSPAIDPNVILHIDHIVPWSKGGETTFENLQTLCSKCNIGKGNLGRA